MEPAVRIPDGKGWGDEWSSDRCGNWKLDENVLVWAQKKQRLPSNPSGVWKTSVSVEDARPDASAPRSSLAYGYDATGGTPVPEIPPACRALEEASFLPLILAPPAGPPAATSSGLTSCHSRSHYRSPVGQVKLGKT
jgi:hypothetical protein